MRFRLRRSRKSLGAAASYYDNHSDVGILDTNTFTDIQPAAGIRLSDFDPRRGNPDGSARHRSLTNTHANNERYGHFSGGTADTEPDAQPDNPGHRNRHTYSDAHTDANRGVNELSSLSGPPTTSQQMQG